MVTPWGGWFDSPLRSTNTNTQTHDALHPYPCAQGLHGLIFPHLHRWIYAYRISLREVTHEPVPVPVRGRVGCHPQRDDTQEGLCQLPLLCSPHEEGRKI